jgi:hypothetical protein
LGSNLPKAAALAELYALIAARLSAVPVFTVLLQDSLAIRAIVMIVIYVSVLGRIFQ